MTQKIPFEKTAGKKKHHRRNERRILFHFVLFTALAVLLIAAGIYGRIQLNKIAEQQIASSRQSLLVDETTSLLKSAAEASAGSQQERTKISSGLSSKSRSIKSSTAEMIEAGKSNEEIVSSIVDTLSAAAVSRLTGEDEATQALKKKVEDSLSSQRSALIESGLSKVESALSALSMKDIRVNLNSKMEHYTFMYYSPLMITVGIIFLVIGLFMGWVHFFCSRDFRVKVADIVEPLDYLLPFSVGVIVFTLYPTVRVFIMAFQQRYKLTGEFNGWGLGNFHDVLSGVNTKLPQALGNTFLYVLLTVPISVAISILLAYLLNQKIKLRALFHTAYFLPMVTSAVAVGMVWKFMFNGDYGILNWLLGLFGGPKIPWLTRPEYSMAVMVIYGIWDSLPMTIILLISGLQNIDEHYYTVAKVDGAKAKRIFFRITVPLLSPTIGLVLIINSISAFKVFNSVVVLFSGTPGPMYNMYTMVYYIYEQINTSLEYGRAAAASLILFAVILVFTMLQRLIQRKWTYN